MWACDDEHVAGYGTYEHNGYIYSSVAGIVNVQPKEKVNVIEVHTDQGQSSVPVPGDIVTAEVTVITLKIVRCRILCLGDSLLSKPLRGVIKKDDIRASNKDKIETHKSFRPGDIILARVLPIKEVHSYPLSTAENELGVVIAYSEAGVAMFPISWTEMQCPKTYNKESRKVAKFADDKMSVNALIFSQTTN